MSSPFQPHAQRAAAAPPPTAVPPAAHGELDALHDTRMRLARGFAVANGALFAVTLLLACTAGGLLGTEVAGRINLGMALGLVQGVLLLGSAALFDRRSRRTGDRAADRLRERITAATRRPAQPSPAAAGPYGGYAGYGGYGGQSGQGGYGGHGYDAMDAYLYDGRPPTGDGAVWR
ncbi:DUF485 domain-containing protein [Kitasatospora camelliae]|uniref:DUF485 domain-containing protein n=1 Tax=Kitasatospora camelliae TaxID=3156397 RepID=A0AAU8K4E9_9ACTN